MLDEIQARLEVLPSHKLKVVMEIIKLSPTENDMAILKDIHSLRAFECLEVTADASGKPDYYLVRRQTKMLLTQSEPRFTK